MSTFSAAGGGGVPVSATLAGASNPTVANLDATTAGTEYSYALPTSCVRFTIRARGKSTLQLAYVSGNTGTEYITVSRHCSYVEEGLTLGPGVVVYFQADQPNETIEIVSWV